MQDFNQKNIVLPITARTQSGTVTQAGRSVNHDTDRFPVDALLPCITYPRGTYPPPPDHEIPNLATMTDGERRLWMAPRRDLAVQDQLPQPGYAADGRPSGDLQPGTQRKQAASSDSARQTAQAVALAVGVTSFPGSHDGPRVIAGARYGTTFSTEGVQRNRDQPSFTIRCRIDRVFVLEIISSMNTI